MRGEIPAAERLRPLIGLLLAAVLGAACDDAPASPTDESEVRVAAAASLLDVMRALREAAPEQRDQREQLEQPEPSALPLFVAHMAGSEILVRQVEQGYRPQLMILARPLTEDERALGVQSAILLTNQLVVAVRADEPDPPRTLADLRGRGLIAVADPELAPAGVWARKALEATGEWEALSSQFLEAGDVRMACSWTLLEEARAVICYRSDVVALDGLAEAFPLGDGRVPYEALAFDERGALALAALKTAEAVAIFKRFGFEPAP